MPIPFLSAHWRNLVVATYAAPEELLARHLPPGVDLDRRDGEAFCSLVGFQFRRAAAFGVPSPLFRDFPEWNLRIYVRRGEERGVRFVREFVPHRLVAWAGRLLYHERFEAAPVAVKVTDSPDALTVEYTVERGGRTHRLTATGGCRTECPSDGDAGFLESECAFNRTRGGGLMRFGIARPPWEVHPLRSFRADVDWGALYGPEWAAMTGREPVSALLVRGSEVTVHAPRRIAIGGATAARLQPA